jgi:hypothetical protein
MSGIAQHRVRKKLQSAWLTGLSFWARCGRPRFVAPNAILTATIFAVGSLWPNPLRAETKEYDLKAVLLYHFTQFVEWPPASFPQPDTPLIIGIVGPDPFGKVLDDLVRQETYNHRRIVVERYRSIDVVGKCHILFVAASESRNLPRILVAMRGRPVLTVGDFETFAARGGMIRFIRNPEEKITLWINLDAAKASGLTISARLLHVAEIVSTTEK